MAGEVIGQGIITVDADTSSAEAALQRTESAANSAGAGGVAAGASIRESFSAAAKSLQQSTFVSELETVGALGIQVGGTFSRLSSVFTSLVRPVAIAVSVLGPLPLAIGAGSAAAAGGALAIRAYANSMLEAGEAAVEAGERLSELNLLTEEDRVIVERLASAQSIAARSADELAVAKARLHPMTTLLTEAYAGWQMALTSVTTSMADTRAEIERNDPTIGRLLSAIGDGPGVIIPLNLALQHLASTARNEVSPAFLEARAKLIDLGQAAMDSRLADDLAEQQADEMLVLLSELAAERERARAAERRWQAEVKATSALALEARQAYYSGVIESAQKAEQDEIDAIMAVRQAESKAYEAQTVEVDAIVSARASAAVQWQAQVDAAKEQAVAASAMVVSSTLQGLETIASAYAQQISDRMAAGEQVSLWEVRQANRAIDAAKVAAISQAAISAALAGAGIAANLAPFLGPAAIGLGVAAGSALFFASVAAIQTGSPLSLDLPSGGGEAATSNASDSILDSAAGAGRETKGGGTVGPKGENSQAPDQMSRRSGGGGVTVGLDPRLQTLQITTNARPGKRPPRGGR